MDRVDKTATEIGAVCRFRYKAVWLYQLSYLGGRGGGVSVLKEGGYDPRGRCSDGIGLKSWGER